MRSMYFHILYLITFFGNGIARKLKISGWVSHMKLLPVIFIFLDSCIEPLKVDLIRLNPQLVIDGLITNEPGPYEIKLFYSTQLDNTVRKATTETNASVWILSDDNESEKLTEVTPGTYQTDSSGIQGQIGRSYKLKITTHAGKNYETDFLQMNPPGTLDSVFVSFDPNAIVDNAGANFKDGLKLSVNARGDSNGSNLFRWHWKSVYEAKSFPERRKEYQGTVLFPAPEPCSGYIQRGMGISKVGECTCCICWTSHFSSASVVSENDYVKDFRYTNVQIGEIELNSMLFYDRLFFEVEQLSVTDDVYEFWKLVEKQEKSTGNLFQPNAIQIRGNIVSLSNPDEDVLGIFSVSAIARKTIFVDRSVVPYALPPIDTLDYDCRTVFENPTTEKPPFW